MATAAIPSSVDSFTQKWQGQVVGSDAGTATLQRIDLQRIAAGKKALTAEETQNAIQAVNTRTPTTPVPERTNMWALPSNAVHDVTDLVRGIPQLPMGLLNEGREILNIGDHIDDVDSLGDVASLPGIRLIPGSFALSALLPGGRPAGELLTKPVSTALDILPFASAATKAVGASALRASEIGGRVGELSSAEQAAARLREVAAGGDRLPLLEEKGLQIANAAGAAQPRRIIPDLLTKTVDPLTGEIIRRPGLESFRGTQLGQKAFQFGEENRANMSVLKRNEASALREGNQLPGVEAGRALEQDMLETFSDRVNEVSAQIRTAIEDPGAAGFQTTAEARAALPPEAQPFYDRTRKALDDLQAQQFKDDWESDLAQAPNIAKYTDGEIYTAPDIRKLTTRDNALTKAMSKYTARKPEQFLSRLGVRNDGLGRFVSGMVENGTDPLAGLQEIKARWGTEAMEQTAEYGQVLQEQATIARYQAGDIGPGELRDQLLPTNRRTSKGLLNPKEFSAYSRDVQSIRSEAFKRMKAGESTIPARYMPTGKRLFYEEAKKNYDLAQELDPELRRRYKAAQDMEPPAKANYMTHLRQEVDPETFRLLKYTRPDVDQIWAVSDELFRQKLSSFMEPSEYSRLAQDVRKNLNGLRAGEYEPAYIPGVAYEKAIRLDTAELSPANFSPDYVKARTFDYAPQYPGLGVSVAYTALQDYMARVAIPHHIQAVEDMAGIPGVELTMQLQAEAESAIARTKPANPDLAIKEYVDLAKKRRYAQLDPDSYFGTKSGLAGPTRPLRDQMFIPKEFDTTLRAMAESEQGFFQQLADPLSKTFRTSVLLFSPAWHFNNILSGAMMTAITNPKAFLELRNSWQSLGGWGGLKGAAKEAEGLSEAAKSVQLDGAVGGMMQDLRSVPEVVQRAENGLSRTRTVSRIWNQIQEAKVASGAIDRFNSVKDFSAGLNGLFDDMFRVADFEAGFKAHLESLVKEGQPLERATQVAAERALKNTQTVFMDISQMLPIERGILRAVFPFYAWTSHIMRLAFKLPFDHPLRVATINNVTRAEIDDWQAGYPQIFRRLLGFADPKTATNYIGLNVDAFNPFRDVGNTFTMAGVAGMTNPLIQEMFRQLGVDPSSGGPEYQPNFVYDPTSSTQTLDTGNPIINLAGNIVPQAQTLARFFGLDADFRKLEVSNPAAAQRMILSGLRLPIVYRSVNIPEALALEEVKRTQALKEATATANKTGDVRQVAQFSPAMAANLKAMYANKQAAAQQIGRGPVRVPGSFITV